MDDVNDAGINDSLSKSRDEEMFRRDNSDVGCYVILSL